MGSTLDFALNYEPSSFPLKSSQVSVTDPCRCAIPTDQPILAANLPVVIGVVEMMIDVGEEPLRSMAVRVVSWVFPVTGPRSSAPERIKDILCIICIIVCIIISRNTLGGLAADPADAHTPPKPERPIAAPSVIDEVQLGLEVDIRGKISLRCRGARSLLGEGR
jgi:hypothetical protein